MEAQELLLFEFEYGSSSDDENDVSQETSDSNNCYSNSLDETQSKQNSSNIVNATSEQETRLLQIEVISKARTDDGTLKCLKCIDYKTNNEEDFYAHVKSTHTWSNEEILQLFHKNGDRSEFWCPECNDTFVTKLALTRHLKVS